MLGAARWTCGGPARDKAVKLNHHLHPVHEHSYHGAGFIKKAPEQGLHALRALLNSSQSPLKHQDSHHSHGGSSAAGFNFSGLFNSKSSTFYVCMYLSCLASSCVPSPPSFLSGRAQCSSWWPVGSPRTDACKRPSR